MPIDNQSVQPSRISATGSAVNDADELAYIANFTLCNLIRQLGSVSEHTAAMFRNINVKVDRIKHKQARIDQKLCAVERTISAGVNGAQLLTDQQLDQSDEDESPLADAYHRIALPAPALYMLNRFRDDNRDSSAFYSDTGVFRLHRRSASKPSSSASSRPSSQQFHYQHSRPPTISASSMYGGVNSVKSGRSNAVTYRSIGTGDTRSCLLPPCIEQRFDRTLSRSDRHRPTPEQTGGIYYHHTYGSFDNQTVKTPDPPPSMFFANKTVVNQDFSNRAALADEKL